MTEAQLRQKLQDLNIPWKTFLNFIKGQTFQLTENNEPYFFKHDVERFLAAQNGQDVSHDWD